jgi:hypothetical protein
LTVKELSRKVQFIFNNYQFVLFAYRKSPLFCFASKLARQGQGKLGLFSPLPPKAVSQLLTAIFDEGQ